MARVPITLVSGPLGSGKTTLLRHLLETTDQRIAILMNEFGELAIDSKVLEGKNIRLAELDGGCVCCSLLGEFEAAVTEILETVDPDRIVVETTGLAEPEALAFDIQESLVSTRLDGIAIVVDADAMIRFPRMGHTTRLQIEAADFILLNKVDLVAAEQLPELERRLTAINDAAPVLRVVRCRLDPELLFGIGRERQLKRPASSHAPEFESFTLREESVLDRPCFERFAESLPANFFRAKGFVRFSNGTHLFNFVAGRWDLEPLEVEEMGLVFIGPGVGEEKERLQARLQKCRENG